MPLFQCPGSPTAVCAFLLGFWKNATPRRLPSHQPTATKSDTGQRQTKAQGVCSRADNSYAASLRLRNILAGAHDRVPRPARRPGAALAVPRSSSRGS